MMKVFKKVLSCIMILSLLIGTIALASCGKTAKASLSVGEWLQLVVEKFDIDPGESAEPLIESIDEDSAYYNVVQAACAWNIISKDDTLELDNVVSKEYCAVTLVKAVGIEDTEELSNDEIAQLAVDGGYVTFDYRGHVDSGRHVSLDEAKKSLDASYSLWANRVFGDSVESVEYADGVVAVADNDSYDTLSDKIVHLDNNTIAMPKELAEGIRPGSVYVAPSENKQMMTYMASSIREDDDYVILTNSTANASFEDVVKELHASGTFTPNLTESTIIDGAGNVINQAPTAENMGAFRNASTQFLSTNATVAPMKTSFTLNFEVGDLKISGSVSDKDISFAVIGTVWKSKDNRQKVTVSKSYAIKDIKFNYDYDYSWFKLHSAYARLDYTTVDTTGAEYSYVAAGNFAPSYTNGNGKFLTNFKRAVLKDSEAAGAKSIKICKIPLYSAGALSFSLDVKLKIAISGEITLEVTTNNCKGIEYRNGSVSLIKDEKKDTNLTAEGRAEATMYVGVSFNAVGFVIVGVGLEGGIGVKANVTVHLADSENHELDQISIDDSSGSACESSFASIDGMTYEHTSMGTLVLHKDICVDIVTYGILKFTIDAESLICKFCDCKFSHDIYNEENAKIKELSLHMDNGKKVSDCTLKYKEIEGEDQEAESVSQVEISRGLLLNTYFTSLSVGESFQIEVERFPKDCDKSSIQYISANEKVAKVDSNGKVTAVGQGNIEIQVRAKDSDGKDTYQSSCNVLVISDGVEFNELESKKFSWKPSA